MTDFDDDDAVLLPDVGSAVSPPASEDEDVLTIKPTDDVDAEDADTVPSESASDGADSDVPDDDFLESNADLTDEESDEDLLMSDGAIDLRGEKIDNLANLIQDSALRIGASALENETRTVGSWHNIMYRVLRNRHEEEERIQHVLEHMSPEDKVSLNHRLVQNDKTVLRTNSIIIPPAADTTKNLSGVEAMLAFECLEAGGGYRVPLYNSGITLDIIVPTGNDMQTMITNCLILDKQLGSSLGAHYFTYNDLVYKSQIVNFIRPLIVDSSFVDWKKSGQLWSVIKMPDLMALVATVAAICYKDGFENFRTRCSRPACKDHPTGCQHVETITADIFKMIVTRWAAMSQESIDFIVKARASNRKNTLGQIAKYQAGLGLEGERITFDDLTFVMRIPSVSEYLDAGSKFIADIINEIEGDNTDGHYEQFGLRYIRTFLPWIATIERKGRVNNVVRTSEPAVITRFLEKIDHKYPNGEVAEKLRDYVDRVQLTYVGYPVLPCSVCNYTADIPSGMRTFDPFNAFFTLAFHYSTQPSSLSTTD